MDTLPELEEIYGDKLAVEFRHNPLPMHQFAMDAAKASMAAHLQGRFWEMEELLFRNRSDLSKEKLVALARQLGLDVDRFLWDMADPRVERMILSDQATVRALGQGGTPVFFINGRVIVGAQKAEEFRKVIDEEIAKSQAALQAGVAMEKLLATQTAANGADPRLIQHFVENQPFPVAGQPAQRSAR